MTAPLRLHTEPSKSTADPTKQLADSVFEAVKGFVERSLHRQRAELDIEMRKRETRFEDRLDRLEREIGTLQAQSAAHSHRLRSRGM
jgi:hypothetical protein